MAEMQREHWGSKIGFVLAAAGSAVGLGNIWKFPYVTGDNGGAAFVLIYLICIMFLGLPIMIAELVIGRHTRKDPVGAFKAMAKGTHWELVGYIGVLSGFFILSFYSVVGGWTLGYLVKSLTGAIATIKTVDNSLNMFGSFVANPMSQIGYHMLFMVACVVIVIRGIANGIERWSKFLMPFLFLLLIVLIIKGISMKGGIKGVLFLMQPDFGKISFNSFMTALGHAFFTLSLGMGAMITYGSYLSQKDKILSSALYIVILDTILAILAGLAIFPAVFAMNIEPSQGAGLIFNIIPAVFGKIEYGSIFSFIFFLLLFIAALTSAMSLLEVVTTFIIDEHGWSRRNAVVLMSGIIFLLGIPSALSFNVMADIKIFFGMNFFDFMDTLTANYMLPIGGFLIAVFLGWQYGFDKTEHELETDTKSEFIKIAWAFTLKYISPTILLVFFIYYLANNPDLEWSVHSLPRMVLIIFLIYYLVIAATTRDRSRSRNGSGS